MFQFFVPSDFPQTKNQKRQEFRATKNILFGLRLVELRKRFVLAEAQNS